MQPVQLGLEIRRPSEPNHQFLLGLITFLLFPNPIVTECTNAENSVTMQLSRAHILRTWQPDGAHCRWWESRQSETNRFPAAVRSGPRWLVMQLRQPLMLEAVSVRGWDGQWQAAAPGGSAVSAFGAASLPLMLQLEDSCRASWETVGSSDRWGQLEGQSVSFILLNSSQPLQWSSLSLKGRTIPLHLNVTRNPFCLNCEPLTWRPGDTIGFSVSSCGSQQPPECAVRMADGRQNKTTVLATRKLSGSSQITHFEFWFKERSVPRTLMCWQGSSAALKIEKEVAIPYSDSSNYTLSVSPVWVSGRPVSVRFESVRVFPEPTHQCSIEESSQTGMVLEGQSRSQIVEQDAEGRVLLSARTKFQFNATAAMTGGQILCWANLTGSAILVTTAVKKTFNITSISEPCQTTVVLDSSPYWQVGETRQITVNSSSCSNWNVSHSCRLLLDGAASSIPLNKTQQDGFSSAHELEVSRSMALQNWSVRCSVNQSDVEYDDAESLRELQPQVFYPANIIQVHASIESTKMFLTVKTSAGRPAVNSVTCLVSNSVEKNFNLELDKTETGHWKNDDFKLQAEICNRQDNNSAAIEVICTAQQVFNDSAVFELSNRTFVNCSPIENYETNTESTDSTRSPAAIPFLLVTAALMALASMLLIWKLVQTNQTVQTLSRTSTTSSLVVDQLLPTVSVATAKEPRRSCNLDAGGVTIFSTALSVCTLQASICDEEQGSDSDEDPLSVDEFTEAIGHYESDGSTFVPYDLSRLPS